MREKNFPVAFILILLLFPGPVSALPEAPSQEEEESPPRLLPFAEIEAFPLFGLDRLFRGGGGSCVLGIEYFPFSLGIRSGAAYDLGLDSSLLRFDLELGFGEELRAVVGYNLPLDEPCLGADRLPVEAAPWPNRFGLEATLFEPTGPFLGGRARVDASLVYAAYRFAAGTAPTAAAALSGTAAFAAGLEAQVLLRLRWLFPGRPKGGGDLDRGAVPDASCPP